MAMPILSNLKLKNVAREHPCVCCQANIKTGDYAGFYKFNLVIDGDEISTCGFVCLLCHLLAGEK